MTRYYIDACIWRDYFENRSDKFRPLGEWSLKLFNKIVKDESKVLISELLLIELRKAMTKEEISNLLSIFDKKQIELVKCNKQSNNKAIQLCKKYKIHFNDALHAVLAEENDAILVTRDKHFNLISIYIRSYKPEDLI